MWRRLLGLTLSGFVLSLVSLQCGGDASEEVVEPVVASDEATTGVSMYQNTSIDYQLEWDWQDARKVEGGYRFTNDLGYTFTINTMHVTTGALELRPCVVTQSASRWSFGIAKAFADHAADEDSSRARRTISEGQWSRVTPYAQGLSSGQPYCQLHVLFAPGVGPATDGVQMSGLSLKIVGSYQAPQSTEATPFEASINLKNGGNNPLRKQCNVQATHPTVRVIRRPQLAFHGIQPERVSSHEFAYRVALQLASSIDAIIELPGTVACP